MDENHVIHTEFTEHGWTASCECGWEAVPPMDETGALDAAADHEG